MKYNKKGVRKIGRLFSYPQAMLCLLCYNITMKKEFIIFIVVLLLATGGAYYFGYQMGYDAGKEVGRAVAQIGAGAAVTNPLEKLPATNPFEKAVNPFKDLYQNPFK